MKTRLVLACALVLSLSGCGSIYTHIYKVDQNTYYLTRTKQGLVPYGTLFRCQTMQNADLNCVEIDTP